MAWKPVVREQFDYTMSLLGARHDRYPGGSRKLLKNLDAELSPECRFHPKTRGGSATMDAVSYRTGRVWQ